MKYFTILIILFFIACRTQPPDNNDVEVLTDETVNRDQVSSPATEYSGMDTNSGKDQIFMEFFSRLMWDYNFQKDRIIFPINDNGKEIKSASHWDYREFYVARYYIPILHQDTITYYDRDIKEDKVIMSMISFQNNETENYIFLKDSVWKLQAITTQSFDSLKDLDFINFLKEFSSDPVFQIQNIQFPLPYYFTDAENDYKEVYDPILQKDWQHMDFTEELEGMMSLNITPNSPYRKIFLMGNENGIHVSYTFINYGKSWRLIKIEDYST